MAKIYANRVFYNKWTWGQVPERWREQAKIEYEKMKEKAEENQQ